MEVVKVEHVSRVFGEVMAVNDLTLTLNAGEVMGFLGTNGAGKTIKMLLGLIKPTEGTVSVMGGDPSDPQARARIGYMPEIAYYYPYLNARELLDFYGGICGLDKKTIRSRADVLLEKVGLADAAKRPLKTLRVGEQLRQQEESGHRLRTPAPPAPSRPGRAVHRPGSLGAHPLSRTDEGAARSW